MALKAELTRRELAEHVAMLAAADDANRLRQPMGPLPVIGRRNRHRSH